MNAAGFDRLTRILAVAGTRRGVARLLSALPLGVLLTTLAGETPAATAQDDDHGSSHRRRRRKTRHKHAHNTVRRNKPNTRHKRKPNCSPRGCPADPACGSQPDGCGGTVRCGCSGNRLCVDGTCRACDVCQPPGACAFASVQDAILANPPRDTIVICPGTYVENALPDFSAVRIFQRSVRLIGAGDGPDPGANTLLTPQDANQRVVEIEGNGQDIAVSLEGLRLTGATGNGGFGLGASSFGGASVDVTLTDCTFTNNNGCCAAGGLVVNHAGVQVTLVDTHITANTGDSAGGIEVLEGRLTLDALSRVTGNTATSGFGGIRAFGIGASVYLPSAANVTGNFSPPGNNNCGGDAVAYSGAGAICTTT